MAGESLTPAGWYRDPQNADQLRYWDGVAWAAAGVAPPPDVAAHAIQEQTTNGFAIASLVSGILWIYGLGSILALVFGYIAKKQIAASNGRQRGGGMATAGIVLGVVGLVVVIGLTLLFVVAIHQLNTG